MAEAWATTDDGVRLWCAAAGAGPPVVLCHGGPGLDDDLAPLAALLAGAATVVRWQQRGVGRSDPVGPHTLDRYVADLDAVRRHLGHDRWVVGGHSFGATIALRYALAHPDRARGLLYVSGVGTGRGWHAAHEDAAARRLTPAQRQRRDELGARDRSPDEEVEWRALSWLPDFAATDDAEEADEAALALAAAMAERAGPICWDANRALSAEVWATDEDALLDRCRGLAVPALLLHGAEDTRPAWALDTLAAALPRARVVVIPGAGHRPWVEAPDAVRAAVTAFVGQL